MKTLVRILPAVVLTAILCGFVWSVLRPAEPVYNGKPLSVWLNVYTENLSTRQPGPNEHLRPDLLEQYVSSAYSSSTLGSLWERQWKEESDEAVAQIGTNAIPILLRRIQAEDSPLKLKLERLAGEHNFAKKHFVSAGLLNRQAMEGFRVLGARASNAVPDLVEVYQLKLASSDTCRFAILISLGNIGPGAKAAAPMLTQLATTTRGLTNYYSLEALIKTHSDHQIVVPILTQLLRSPDVAVRRLSAQGLGEDGSDARPAIAGLVRMFDDSSGWNRDIALHALRQIYAKANWIVPMQPDEWRKWIVPMQWDEWREYDTNSLIQAIKSLGERGTNAEPAIPVVLHFILYPDKGVKTQAVETLKLICPEVVGEGAVK